MSVGNFWWSGPGSDWPLTETKKAPVDEGFRLFQEMQLIKRT